MGEGVNVGGAGVAVGVRVGKLSPSSGFGVFVGGGVFVGSGVSVGVGVFVGSGVSVGVGVFVTVGVAVANKTAMMGTLPLDAANTTPPQAKISPTMINPAVRIHPIGGRREGFSITAVFRMSARAAFRCVTS